MYYSPIAIACKKLHSISQNFIYWYNFQSQLNVFVVSASLRQCCFSSDCKLFAPTHWEINSSEFTWHCSQQPCSLARRSITDTLMCSRLSTLRIHCVNFKSLHSCFPSANSIIIIPRDQTSTLGPDLAPRPFRYTSGAIYFGCL